MNAPALIMPLSLSSILGTCIGGGLTLSLELASLLLMLHVTLLEGLKDRGWKEEFSIK